MSSGWGPYLQKEEAKRNLYRAFAAQPGVTLYGHKPDTSDPMTDYYSPESWDGVATYGDYVICVSVSEYATHDSGQTVAYYDRAPETFPTFQANPKGRTWHIEQGGVILASGTGINACTRDGQRKAQSASGRDHLVAAASAKLVTKILGLCDRLSGKGMSPMMSKGVKLSGMEPALSKSGR